MLTRIRCEACERVICAQLVSGLQVYPHREDLADLPFWQCNECKNFVGCHYKTSNPTKPLGCIVDKETKAARIRIHKLLDPIWKNASDPRAARNEVYRELSLRLGYKYHTGSVRNLKEAREVYKTVLEIKIMRGMA